MNDASSLETIVSRAQTTRGGEVKRALFAIITVAAGVLIVAGSVLFFAKVQSEPATLAATVVGTAQTPQGELPHATVELSVYPNSSAEIPGPTTGTNKLIDSDGWPFYWPSTTLQLPAHSLVTMTIHQYGFSSPVWNPYFAKVHGTVDGTALFNGVKRSDVDPNNVAHTFTIHQYPESTQPYFFVNIPLPSPPANAPTLANGYASPQEITFSFITGAPGEYIWNCEDPCGDGYADFGGVMGQRGWMSGTVTIV